MNELREIDVYETPVAEAVADVQGTLLAAVDAAIERLSEDELREICERLKDVRDFVEHRVTSARPAGN